MKIPSLLIVCFLCLALFANAGITEANSLPRTGSLYSPQSNAALAASLAFDHDFLALSEEPGNHPYGWSHTVVDAMGGVHVAYSTSGSIYYAYCIENCGSADGWILNNIASTGQYASLTYPSLALDSIGRPRIIWYTGAENGWAYVYAECNANCTQPNSWAKANVQIKGYSFAAYPSDTNYFAVDTKGRPRFISRYYDGLIFTYCDSACTDQTRWVSTTLAFGNQLADAQLVLNSAGQPRAVGLFSSSTGGYQLEYAECNLNCAQAANWKLVKVAAGLSNNSYTPSYAFRLDAQGRPRVAFFKPGVNSLFYAWSNGNFTTASSWTVDSLDSILHSDNRTLDMVIDSQGSPHIVFANDKLDLRYIKCTTNCNTLNSLWFVQDIELGDVLDQTNPIPYGQGAWGSAWWVGENPSAALDSMGRLSVSYFARNVEFVGNSAIDQAWSIRFATAGGAGPRTWHNPVFIPLLYR